MGSGSGSIISGHVDWSDTFGPGAGSDVGRGNQKTQHLKLATGRGNRTVRLNVKTFDDANAVSGSIIGFQSKPRIGIDSTGTVVGCEISSQVADDIEVANMIGGHVDCYVRGTTGDISGDVRGLQVELVTDDAGTRTISGNVSHVRLRSAFSGTITGSFSAFRVEKPEAQTGSNDYDFLFQLTGVSAAWAPTGTPSTQAGFIKVEVNGTTKYIQLYTNP
jgi:hypothetical protein